MELTGIRESLLPEIDLIWIDADHREANDDEERMRTKHHYPAKPTSLLRFEAKLELGQFFTAR
jgi:hypothetical protein